MCNNNGVDYEKEELRNAVDQYQKNHLGSTTERFIEMARNEGHSQHLNILVQELSSKLERTVRELNDYKGALAERDRQLEQARKNADSWRTEYYSLDRRYTNYRQKNAPKKPAAKKTK